MKKSVKIGIAVSVVAALGLGLGGFFAYKNERAVKHWLSATFSKKDPSGQEQPSLEATLKALLGQEAGGVFALSEAASEAARAGVSPKTEEQAPATSNALRGKDEAALLAAMQKEGLLYLVLPNEDRNIKSWPAGSIGERLAAAGPQTLFARRYVDDGRVLYTPKVAALTPSEPEIAALFAYARATLSGAQAPALPERFTAPAKRPLSLELRFTSQSEALPPYFRRGEGMSVKEALDKAIAPLKQNPNTAERLPKALLRLNLWAETAPMALDARSRQTQVALGVDGLILRSKGPQSREIVLTPDKARLNRANSVERLIQVALRQLGGGKELTADNVAIEVFRPLELAEKAPGGAVAALLRGADYLPPAAMTKEETLVSFKDAADWLLANFDREKKMYGYNYFVVRNNFDTRNYNIVRHGLATLTMLQAYEITKDRRYLETAKLATEWVLALVEWDGKLALFKHEKLDPKYKLGGAGTMLQVMTEYYRLEKIPEWEKVMKGMAEFIIAMQEENGHYRSYYTKAGEKPDNNEVTIYPGEANLALLRMYKIFKDKRYLSTVDKAFTYYSKWFNGKKSPDSKSDLGAFVPWDMSAMLEYYELVKRDEVAAYAYSMADWVIDNWFIFGDKETYWPDYVGGIHNSKAKWDMPIWNSGVYGEGIASVFQIAELHGDKERAAKYRLATHRITRFVRQIQFNGANLALLPDPAKAKGCIPSDFFGEDCRIDYVYHCMTTAYRELAHFDEADWQAVAKAQE